MNETQFDEIIDNALRNTRAPSLSVAATREGEVCYVKAFGDAGERGVYNIASVTKQFTAACVLLLQRKGRLTLGDTVAKWFPDLNRAGDITLRHLLSHTSGYRDYYPLGYPDEEKYAALEPEEIVRRYASLPLQFEPGAAWSYSNTGYHLAGLIVERVSGQSFGTFLTENVLTPAGMHDSFFNDPPRVSERHVPGYTRYCLGPLRKSEGERAGWMYASGGIASTARDLAHWHTILMNGGVLEPDEVAIATGPVPLSDPGPSRPALGWFVEDRGGHTVVQHSGGLAGFGSQTILSLDRRASVVVLANGDHVQTGPIASRLFEALFPGAAAPQPAKPDVSADALERTRGWIRRFSRGDVPRAQLTGDLSAFLTQARIEDAALGLFEAGALNGLDATASGERGDMEWQRLRATFSRAQADVLIRLTHSGDLAEFNAYPLP